MDPNFQAEAIQDDQIPLGVGETRIICSGPNGKPNISSPAAMCNNLNIPMPRDVSTGSVFQSTNFTYDALASQSGSEMVVSAGIHGISSPTSLGVQLVGVTEDRVNLSLNPVISGECTYGGNLSTADCSSGVLSEQPSLGKSNVVSNLLDSANRPNQSRTGGDIIKQFGVRNSEPNKPYLTSNVLTNYMLSGSQHVANVGVTSTPLQQQCKDTENRPFTCAGSSVYTGPSAGSSVYTGPYDKTAYSTCQVRTSHENVSHGPCEGNENIYSPMDVNAGPMFVFHGNVGAITGSWNEFHSKEGECFTKGCKWAPDGTCILTNSEDNMLRIFDLPAELHCQESWPRNKTLPEMKPVLKMPEGGLVYDYCWYPLMSSWNPLSCCLVSTSQYNPLHMWDAFTGELRATYRAYNQMDEVISANCVTFDRAGEKLYSGFNNAIRVFDTSIPGRQCETRSLKNANVSMGSQRGLISCITVNPEMQKVYAVGSYLRSIGLYSEPGGTSLCVLTAHTGGVSHLAFSPDGTKLFSGGRKDPEIVCWDVRNPGRVLFRLERQAGTNQRIYFDITPDGRYLLSGNSDGMVRVWDLTAVPQSRSSYETLMPPHIKFKAHDDCVNGLSIHQQYSIVATSSGQRHFEETSHDSSSESDEDSAPVLKRKYIQRENSLKLWWVGREG